MHSRNRRSPTRWTSGRHERPARGLPRHRPRRVHHRAVHRDAARRPGRRRRSRSSVPVAAIRFRSFERGLVRPAVPGVQPRQAEHRARPRRPTRTARRMRELLDTADVYVQNFRPGVAERLGVGPADAHAVNPRLVYCAISGFGPDGPYATRPAYDTVGQALSGFLSMFVAPDVAAHRRSGDRRFGDGPVRGLRHPRCAARATRAPARRAVVHVADGRRDGAFLDRAVPPLLRDRRSSRTRLTAAASRSRSRSRCADGGLIAIHLSSPVKFWTGLRRRARAPGPRGGCALRRAHGSRAQSRGARSRRCGRSSPRARATNGCDASRPPTFRTRRSSDSTRRSPIRRCAISPSSGRSRHPIEGYGTHAALADLLRRRARRRSHDAAARARRARRGDPRRTRPAPPMIRRTE